MVASNTLELPYYKGIGRQRGRGFGALAQVIGRTAIPFLRKTFCCRFWEPCVKVPVVDDVLSSHEK